MASRLRAVGLRTPHDGEQRQSIKHILVVVFASGVIVGSLLFTAIAPERKAGGQLAVHHGDPSALADITLTTPAPSPIPAAFTDRPTPAPPTVKSTAATVAATDAASVVSAIDSKAKAAPPTPTPAPSARSAPRAPSRWTTPKVVVPAIAANVIAAPDPSPAWAARHGITVHQYQLHDKAQPRFVPPGRAKENSVYFKFVVDHYDDLPDHTVFVHGDVSKHNPAWPVKVSRNT